MPNSAHYRNGAAAQFGTATIFVPPGTGTLKNALTIWTGKGVTLQLGSGTYTEDVTTWPASVSGVWVKGCCPAGGVGGESFATIVGAGTVITLTKGSTTNDATIFENVRWSDLYFTGSAMGAGTVIASSSSSEVAFLRNVMVDMQGRLIKQVGPNLLMESNYYLQSSATVGSSLGNGVFGPKGPYWSIDEVFDYPAAAGGYVQVTGASTLLFGPWYFVRPIFNPRGIYTQDVALDCEFGQTAGLESLYVEDARVLGMKLAYLVNVGWSKFVRPYQRLTLDFAPGSNAQMATLLTDASTTGYDYMGYCELMEPTIIHDTNSQPNANYHLEVVKFLNKTYMGRFWWHGGSVIVNTANTSGSGGNPALVQFTFPAAAQSPGFDAIDVEDVEVGFNLSAAFPPTAVPVVAVGSAVTPFTGGRVRTKRIAFLGASGGASTAVTVGASVFTYTHGTSGATPATVPGVYQVTIAGATISSIVYTRALTGSTVTATNPAVNQAFYCEIGDTVAITYSAGLPTSAYFAGFPRQPTTAGDGAHLLLTFPLALGTAAKTTTIADEEMEDINLSTLNAASFTGLKVRNGTYTATRAKARGLLPPDAASALTYPGTGTAYKHGSYGTGGTVAKTSGFYLITGGTVTAVALNGTTIFTQAAGSANFAIPVAIDDSVVVTSTVNPTVSYIGTRLP